MSFTTERSKTLVDVSDDTRMLDTDYTVCWHVQGIIRLAIMLVILAVIDGRVIALHHGHDTQVFFKDM